MALHYSTTILVQVLLPLQTDPLLTSLHRTAKQHRTSSPTRQGTKGGPTVGSHAAFSPTIDIRSVALCAFRDRVVVPLHNRLHALLSPAQCKETLMRLGSYRQPRLQQMSVPCSSRQCYILITLQVTCTYLGEACASTFADTAPSCARCGTQRG